mmetsp:Transcript_31780/g.75851  ORF Transcript_31780/g.75851 Transcript_31780/m.75851 type:complete len:126 (-) Transcript_31780:860-1237(-)
MSPSSCTTTLILTFTPRRWASFYYGNVRLYILALFLQRSIRNILNITMTVSAAPRPPHAQVDQRCAVVLKHKPCRPSSPYISITSSSLAETLRLSESAIPPEITVITTATRRAPARSSLPSLVSR